MSLPLYAKNFAHTTRVIRFRSMNQALSYIGNHDSGSLFKRLKAQGVYVYTSGDMGWLESHKTPLRAVGREVVDYNGTEWRTE